MPYDICIPDKKVIVECDGRQHFEQVSNWESPKAIQEMDVYKTETAIDNWFGVIRIHADMVAEENLKEVIELIKENRFTYFTVGKDKNTYKPLYKQLNKEGFFNI